MTACFKQKNAESDPNLHNERKTANSALDAPSLQEKSRRKRDIFPHSLIVYGYQVETYGPYSQNYMRCYFVFYRQCTLILQGIFKSVN